MLRYVRVYEADFYFRLFHFQQRTQDQIQSWCSLFRCLQLRTSFIPLNTWTAQILRTSTISSLRSLPLVQAFLAIPMIDLTENGQWAGTSVYPRRCFAEILHDRVAEQTFKMQANISLVGLDLISPLQESIVQAIAETEIIREVLRGTFEIKEHPGCNTEIHVGLKERWSLPNLLLFAPGFKSAMPG